LEDWEHLQFVHCWFWSNRTNFKYDDENRGFALKGPDLYDPKNPPELPEVDDVLLPTADAAE